MLSSSLFFSLLVFMFNGILQGHAFRGAGRFGDAEERPPPANRTHEEWINDARRQLNWTGYKKDAPYKDTGIKDLSPLAFLPLFNMVWDVLADMMHIMLNVWAKHLFPMLRGHRTPAKVCLSFDNHKM